jgi:hypothetical protein
VTPIVKRTRGAMSRKALGRGEWRGMTPLSLLPGVIDIGAH